MRTDEQEKRAPDRKRGREGAILAAVLIVMLIVGIMGIALIQLGEFNGLETVRQGQKNQAFWSAEAGLHHMRAILRTNSTPPASQSPISTNWLGLRYDVTAVSNGLNSVLVTSTGRVSATFEVVQQTILFVPQFASNTNLPAEFGYGLFVSSSNGVQIYNNNSVSGTVYNGGSSSSGGMTTNSSNSIDTTGTPVVAYFPSNYFEQMLGPPTGPDAGSAAAPTNVVLNGNQTNHFTGKVYLSSITGNGGTLIVNGDLNIQNDGTVNPFFTNNINVIVGGKINISQQFVAGSNCLFYSDSTASDSINFQQTATIGMPGGGSLLLSRGGLLAKQQLTVAGVIFVLGVADLRQNATIYGCVIALGGFESHNSSGSGQPGLTLTYNAALFPDDLGSLFSETLFKVVDDFWQQVFR